MKLSRTFAALILATILLVLPASGQEVYRPVSVTFIYPMSTNGFSAGQVASNFSFNILGGYIGSVRGFELGGIFNIEKNHVAGLQVAGVANAVGENVAGLEIGGVLNAVGKNCAGLQIGGVGNLVAKNLSVGQVAGVLNVCLGSVTGLQLGGVANIAGGEATGLQVAGVANLTARDVLGAQVSGTLNLSRGSCPVQIGVVNIALGQTFSQIGVVNIAGYARGLQLGVVNIARDHSGVPIGLASIVKNGQFHVNFWVDETAPFNVGIKFGSRHFYNVWTYGLQPFGNRSKFGIGLGGSIPVRGPMFVDIDGVYYQLDDGVWPFINVDEYNGLTTVRFTGGIKISPKIAITAGPTLNIWHSTVWNGEYVRFFGIPLGDYDARNYTDIWIGLQIGVQIL